MMECALTSETSEPVASTSSSTGNGPNDASSQFPTCIDTSAVPIAATTTPTSTTDATTATTTTSATTPTPITIDATTANTSASATTSASTAAASPASSHASNATTPARSSQNTAASLSASATTPSTPLSTPPFSSFPAPIAVPRTPPFSSTPSTSTPPSHSTTPPTCSSPLSPSTFRYHYHSPVESTFTFDPFLSLQQSSMRMIHKMKDLMSEKHHDEKSSNSNRVLHASNNNSGSSNSSSVARKLYQSSPDVMRILLLGGGSVGKSTLFKQLVHIFGGGFGERERAYYLPLLVENIVCQIQDLIAIKSEEMGIAPISSDLRDAVKLVSDLPEQGLINQINANHILEIWKDHSMIDRLDILRGLPNPQYVIPRVKIFAEQSYIPTMQDVFAARARTTGIIEHCFSHSLSPSSPSFHYQVFDTGGERNERKKWTHLYEDNPCVVLVVNLFGYCVTLNEDATVNRMLEDLELFEEIVNAKSFAHSVVSVIFNQKDKFRSAIQRGGMPPTEAATSNGNSKGVDCKKLYSLDLLFPEYTGGNDEGKALEFVHEKFKKLDRRPSSSPPVLYFDTNALDTREVVRVFLSIFEAMTRFSLTVD